MGSWLFRKRVKLLPGLHLNISRSGFGLNVGIPGINVNAGKRGVYLNLGLPSTGIYKREKLVDFKSLKPASKSKSSIVTKLNNTGTPTVHNTRVNTQKLKPKNTYIKLNVGDKSRIVMSNIVFGRVECKSSFSDCHEIYTKQFSFMKDIHGEWFINGKFVPKTAQSTDGETYNFFPTLYNGVNITNRTVKIDNNGEINVGKHTFIITINH